METEDRGPLDLTRRIEDLEKQKKILQDADLITDLKYKGKDTWSENKSKTACFVDGGVDKTSIISSAPLSIRAGSYIVRPDAADKNREFFEK